jgi:hypothetical protein
MILSERRLAANKRNAVLSTGPKTSHGKLVSRYNALRHGLARPIASDPTAAKAIAILTSKLAGFSNDPWYRILARDLAESFLDVERVRHVRSEILCELGAFHAEPERQAWLVDQLKKMWRYERRVRSRHRKALRAFYEAMDSGGSVSG